MGGVVDLLEASGADVGVDLCGLETGMAEEFLDGSEVGAVIEEMGGEAVAKLVRGEGRVEAAGGEVDLEPGLDLGWADGLGIV